MQVLKFLVEEGAPIEVVDEIKWSALHHAAGNGYAAIIRYLVEQGTTPDIIENCVMCTMLVSKTWSV